MRLVANSSTLNGISKGFGIMRNHIAAFLVCWLSLFCAAQEKPSVSPESVKSALAQLDPYIRTSLAGTKVPGVAVAVVYNDQVVFLRGYGIRKVGESAQVDPDTVFEIASFSKPITSTILASLVGEGKISWDDRIVDLDPGFRLSSAETTQPDRDPRLPFAPQRPGHGIGRPAGRSRLFAPGHSLSHAVSAVAGPIPQDLCL